MRMPPPTMAEARFLVDHIAGLHNGLHAVGWVLFDAIHLLDSERPEAARDLLAAELKALQEHFTAH